MRRLLRPLLFRRLNSMKADAPDIAKLLATPSWSVRSLLPAEDTAVEASELTPERLHHLLRLSALPPPETPEKEAELLKALHNHLHFVRAVQSVDTTGVEPLTRIEDELSVNEVTWEEIMEAEKRLDEEGVSEKGRLEWEPMALPKRKIGEYFVVDSVAPEEMETDDAESEGENK